MEIAAYRPQLTLQPTSDQDSRRPRIFPILFLSLLLFIISVLAFTPNADPGTGEELAKTYCATCHLYPEPSLLDKKTWNEFVLPNMGWRLGIREDDEDPYLKMDRDELPLVKALNVFPEKALLSRADWKKIVKYYIQNAPDNALPQKDPPTVDKELKKFHVEALTFPITTFPQTCLLKYDSSSGLLYVGDGHNELFAMTRDLQLQASWKIESPPVDLAFQPGASPRVLCIGSLKPSQKVNGSYYAFDTVTATRNDPVKMDQLARPVACAVADVNGDRVNDLIICQFGNFTGKLSWFENGDPHKEHMLKAQLGAIHVEVRDFNGDGKPDIMALMAQAREELLLFTNKGNNEFSEQMVYEFPPVYGMTYFELADFNHDGHPDKLLSNGDNWDLSQIRKNYHGIRILMNDGKNNFKVTKFIPFFGAFKAMARDFDKDGDLDIAAIAFSDKPDEQSNTFLYLENKGDLSFSAASTPAAANGKWLTMEVCDFDHDGDQDIILGSFVFNFKEYSKLVARGVESLPQVLILWNDSK
ncbi:FG-GAP repeat domain-containing protein [Flavihumibacter petaseus]|uniref:Cytochrome c domain-containing protein n=1 Tax=Flavihumibacter petaseus NBRC 106054 TaxID=1220578 RepID=A0A0E9N515_9BACT|nr:VCBS repeat-containing protein [Flavihumibacter petaseus]GAO44430.1 hypothetical protein FPE01S_03_04680 [Flavihumibacter petaseus NBRC 106054]